MSTKPGQPADPVSLVALNEVEVAEPTIAHGRLALPERERNPAYFATSYPRTLLGTHSFWLTAHHCWDVEDTAIRQT